MRRGEIWTVTTRRRDRGRPRMVVILQDDRFDATDSITVCAVTTDFTPAPLLRIPIYPDPLNGLRQPVSLTADKVTTIPRSRFDRCVGQLDDHDMIRLERALMVFIGLAG